MRVRVKLYAGLREKAGKGEMEIEAGTTGDAAKQLRKTCGEDAQFLVNGRNAESLQAGRRLKKGDTLEAFPPVGGG